MTDKIKRARSHIEEARMQIIKAQGEVTGLLENKDLQDSVIGAATEVHIQLQLAFERMGFALRESYNAEKAMESDNNDSTQ